MAVGQLLLPPIFSRLQPRRIWQKDGQEWRLHSEMAPAAAPHAGEIHLRAVDGAAQCAGAGRLCGRRGLPRANCGSQGGVEAKHDVDEGRVRAAPAEERRRCRQGQGEEKGEGENSHHESEKEKEGE